MSSGFGRIEYDGNVIEFTRPWTDFQARRPIKSSTIPSGSGIEETLFFFAQWFINARLNLLDPQEKAQLQRLFEYAQDGGSFTLIRNKDIGAYINFEGGINPTAAPRGLKTNDDVDGTFTRTNVAGSAWYLDEGTGLMTLRDGADVPRFPAGKYGTGIQIDGAAINLIDAPSGDFDAGNWAPTNMTVANDTAETLDPSGVNQAAMLTASAANGVIEYTSATAVGNDVTFACWVKCSTGTVAGTLTISGTTGGSDTTAYTATTVWTRVSLTSDTSGFTGNLEASIDIDTNTEIIYLWGTGLYDSATFDLGTVGALSSSSITRNAELITFPSANIINRDKGSVLMWVKPNFDPTSHSSSRFFFESGDSAGAAADLHVRFFFDGAAGDRLTLEVRADGANTRRIDWTPAVATGMTQDNFHLIGFTWDATVSNGGHINVDGAEIGSGSTNSAFNISETEDSFAIGSALAGNPQSFSTIDEILITKNVLTAAEIAGIFNLGIGLGVPRNRWTVKLMNPNFNPQWLQSDIYDIPMAFKEVLT